MRVQLQPNQTQSCLPSTFATKDTIDAETRSLNLDNRKKSFVFFKTRLQKEDYLQKKKKKNLVLVID